MPGSYHCLLQRETKMKTLSIATLAAALFATPAAVSSAAADTVTLNVPYTGQTLRSGDIAMSLYFTTTGNDGFKVVGTYVSDTDAVQPRRIVMNLSDGDSAKFGLPGHPGTLYEFSRIGDVITVSNKVIEGGF